MATGRPGGRNRKLRDPLFNHTQEVESELDDETFKLSRAASMMNFLSKVPFSLTAPPESIEDIFYSSLHSSGIKDLRILA